MRKRRERSIEEKRFAAKINWSLRQRRSVPPPDLTEHCRNRENRVKTGVAASASAVAADAFAADDDSKESKEQIKEDSFDRFEAWVGRLSTFVAAWNLIYGCSCSDPDPWHHLPLRLPASVWFFRTHLPLPRLHRPLRTFDSKSLLISIKINKKKETI